MPTFSSVTLSKDKIWWWFPAANYQSCALFLKSCLLLFYASECFFFCSLFFSFFCKMLHVSIFPALTDYFPVILKSFLYGEKLQIIEVYSVIFHIQNQTIYFIHRTDI